MATMYWEGKVSAIAQASTVQITAVSGTPSDATYTITIGGVKIAVVGETNVATTANNLKVALAASTHPYFAAVTWTVSTDTVTGTAVTAGEEVVATSSVAGGTGTIGAVSSSVANSSPNDWSDADNWSGGAVPANADVVIIKNTSVSIMWGFAQSAVDLTSLTVEKSFTGTIGLRADTFLSAGASVATVGEYRALYLDIGATDIDLGEHNGPGAPAGSVRINIDNDKSSASELRVHATADSGEGSNPAVSYLAAHSGADIEVRDAPGGVGIATLVPAETATVGDVNVTSPDSTTNVYIGPGCTLTNFSQKQGINEINAAADITAVVVDGGLLLLDGIEYAVATMTINDGTVTDKRVDSGGAEIATLNMNGGELDLTGSAAARTITACNFKAGRILLDDDDVTISSGFIGTATGKRTVTVERGV